MKINVIKNKKIFYSISIAIILIGIIMMFTRGFNLGIDFTGGTSIQIQIGHKVEVADAKEIVDEFDSEAHILHIGNDNDTLLIRSKKDLSNDEINIIASQFFEKYNVIEGDFTSEVFGPAMGKEIRNRAFLSVFIVFVAMLAYISWRFQFKFGVSALIALIHDILIMLAVYAIFQFPVNSSFIAAILTIIGYSINDTIVIFDRIRENRRLNPRYNLNDLINSSVKQSFTRTIITSLITFIAVFILYIIGVEEVKVLALPLMFGLISGTYSSLFIASPLWYDLSQINKNHSK